MRRLVVPLVWLLSLVLAMGAGWWAARQATTPPTVAAVSASAVTVQVVEGTIRVEQPYGIQVSWPTRPAGSNQLAGTLTTLDVPGQGRSLREGDVAYTVDLAPVVVAQGTIPAFRDLREGSRGADVTQLHSVLVRLGYLPASPGDTFTAATTTAVNRWWTKLGLPTTGTVPRGRILFLPALPAVLAPATDVKVGDTVDAGPSLVVLAAAGPEFSFRVLPEQMGVVQTGMRVTISAGDATWQAQVTALAPSPDAPDETIARLGPVAGQSSVCSTDCSKAVAVGGKAVLAGVLTVVPETTGPQVPTAAIRTSAAGSTCVLLAGGGSRPVTVKASARGMSIVSGVAIGERVRVGGGGSC